MNAIILSHAMKELYSSVLKSTCIDHGAIMKRR